jgi:hypothetical protein
VRSQRLIVVRSFRRTRVDVARPQTVAGNREKRQIDPAADDGGTPSAAGKAGEKIPGGELEAPEELIDVERCA